MADTPRHHLRLHVDPAGYEWLDQLAQQTATILTEVPRQDVVVAHPDWCCGNVRLDAARLAACFDWDLVADTTAAIVGLTAGMYTMGGSAGPDMPSVAEVLAFLTDVETAHAATFTDDERRVAAAAGTWNMAYTARCQVSMLDGRPPAGSAVHELATAGQDYLHLRTHPDAKP